MIFGKVVIPLKWLAKKQARHHVVFSVSADLKKIYLPTPLKQQALAQSTQAEGRVSESLHPFIRHGGSGRVCGATAGTGCRRGRGPAELQLENRHFER